MDSENQITTGSIVEIAVPVETLAGHMKRFQELKTKLLDKEDTCVIQGKPYVKRSGWRKFSLAFNLTDEIIQREKEIIEGGFVWRFTVKVTAPNGRSVVAVGSCSSTERDFAHDEHDIYAIAHTRAKNRGISDLIGSGEVSAEEMGGGQNGENNHNNHPDQNSGTAKVSETSPPANPQTKLIWKDGKAQGK